MPQKQSSKQTKASSPISFPIVGIGASAGGLESLKKLFASAKKNDGIAYLVVIHLMPDHPSLMPEILQKTTSISVTEATDGTLIKKDHVYFSPSNKIINIVNGSIKLINASEKKPAYQIDTFLNSLASDQKENAVGIILSGTGTDGTLGIKKIKENKGITIAESEESAKYNGMPKSAIDSGFVDMVMSADHITDRLVQYFHLDPKKNEHDLLTEDSKWLNKIFSILQSKVGHNFSGYKANTILRRISRRMVLAQIKDPNEYIVFLKERPNEIDKLFRELLIGVTSFFRDPKSYDTLQDDVLIKNFQKMDNDETFRVWVPGCSTGEEVYSLAILLKECLDQTSKRIDLQLFGTDINDDGINKARDGLYPLTIETEIRPERLKRYFDKTGNCYKIKKSIRDLVVFSTQDVIKDPPFSKLNLLCCRNLLIYLNSNAQKKIIPLFHYTLKPEGILMLGSSESIGGHSNLFSTVNTKWKIFKKREVPQTLLQNIEFPSGISNGNMANFEVQNYTNPDKLNFVRLSQEAILKQYAPTVLIVEKNGTIQYIQGKTGKYLEATSGEPSNNILDLAREGLRLELSSALRQMSKAKESIVVKNLGIKTNGDYQTINLKINKINDPKELSGKILVCFEDIEPLKKVQKNSDMDPDVTIQMRKQKLYDLEKELQSTRESHQATMEELESSNEELKSTNEELQSSNEELQSTNEELESSKEELQSLNEELQTVNSELQSNVDELSDSHDDMRNLLNSTHIATIFVDNNINVKRFTNEVTNIINLIQTDIGRPLKHVVTNLQNQDLIKDISNVLKTLSSISKEVQTQKGEWYQMDILPYRTIDNRINGAVVTFANIDIQKQATSEMQKTWELTRNVFDLNKNPLVVVDNNGNITIANTNFTRLFDNLIDTTEHLNLFKLDQIKLDAKVLKKILKTTINDQSISENKGFEVVVKKELFSIKTQLISLENTPSSLVLIELKPIKD